MYTCRECERPINQASEICPYCGADLTLDPAAAQTEPAKPRTLRSVLIRWAILLGAISIALWGFLWYVLPERAGDPASRAESQAIESLRELRASLADYAGAQGGAYPPTLEALGERARLPAQRALRGGYQLQYTPGPPGTDGAVRNFALTARAGNYGFRNFYTDETGALHATQENRPATARDPVF